MHVIFQLFYPFRHYLKGPKRGQTDVFVDGLPGIPDNIRSNGKGGFYVNLVAERTPEVTPKNETNEFITKILTKPTCFPVGTVQRAATCPKVSGTIEDYTYVDCLSFGPLYR